MRNFRRTHQHHVSVAFASSSLRPPHNSHGASLRPSILNQWFSSQWQQSDIVLSEDHPHGSGSSIKLSRLSQHPGITKNARGADKLSIPLQDVAWAGAGPAA